MARQQGFLHGIPRLTTRHIDNSTSSSGRPCGRTTKGDAQRCSMPCSTEAVLGRSRVRRSLKILATSFRSPRRQSRTTAAPPSPSTSPSKRRCGTPDRDLTRTSIGDYHQLEPKMSPRASERQADGKTYVCISGYIACINKLITHTYINIFIYIIHTNYIYIHHGLYLISRLLRNACPTTPVAHRIHSCQL